MSSTPDATALLHPAVVSGDLLPEPSASMDLAPAIKDYLPYLEWLGVISLLAFFISLVAIPIIIALLPRDFFQRFLKKRQRPQLTPGRLTLLVVRNLIGIPLVAAGIVMLFLPGQGILTIIIGLTCMAFPGKRKLVRRLVQTPSIQHSLDWVRKKLHRPPFTW